MKRWKAPKIDQANMRQAWHVIYGEPMPKGWRVEWAGFMRGAAGLCVYRERRVLLSYGDHIRKREPRNPLATLAHEFTHAHYGHALRHGKEFRARVAIACRKLGVAPEGMDLR